MKVVYRCQLLTFTIVLALLQAPYQLTNSQDKKQKKNKY